MTTYNYGHTRDPFVVKMCPDCRNISNLSEYYAYFNYPTASEEFHPGDYVYTVPPTSVVDDVPPVAAIVLSDHNSHDLIAVTCTHGKTGGFMHRDTRVLTFLLRRMTAHEKAEALAGTGENDAPY